MQLIQLTEKQTKIAQSIEYILMHIARASNIDDFMQHICKYDDLSDAFDRRQNFLMFIKCIIYNKNYEWDIQKIFKYSNKETKYSIEIIISELDLEINKSQQHWTTTEESYLMIIMLDKKILSDSHLRNFYSKLLVMYFEKMLTLNVSKIYYDILQPWINISTICV